jgi:hypothetical protein
MKREADTNNEIEISTKDSDGGQVIPVRVTGAIELMFAGADAFADRDSDSTKTARGDIGPRRASKAAQT